MPDTNITSNTEKNESILLNHYSDEWRHRHSHFWKILSSLFILNLIITCFPLCCKNFGVALSDVSINAKIFPIAGIIFSLFACILLFFESYKILLLRKEINTLLCKLKDENLKAVQKNSLFNNVKFINFFIYVILTVAMIIIAAFIIACV